MLTRSKRQNEIVLWTDLERFIKNPNEEFLSEILEIRNIESKGDCIFARKEIARGKIYLKQLREAFNKKNVQICSDPSPPPSLTC
jgi:sensor domain CHASE-containing protein